MINPQVKRPAETTPSPSQSRPESNSNWVVILAAGDGRRLEGITANAQGLHVPKQYWSPTQGSTMLEWALARAGMLVPVERTIVVVAEQHRKFWESKLKGLDPRNVIVQPENRGTAIGILLPLLTIALRAPDANVVVLPSDHFVEHEWPLQVAIHRALAHLRDNPREVTLLGIKTETADDGFGWIVPAGTLAEEVYEVKRFVEKPPHRETLDLFKGSALVNSFIFAGSMDSLLELYSERAPETLKKMRDTISANITTGEHPNNLEDLYRELPCLDFSSCFLQETAEKLAVVKVPSCGWSDLGTPQRLRRCLASYEQLDSVNRKDRPKRRNPMAYEEAVHEVSLQAAC